MQFIFFSITIFMIVIIRLIQ